MIHNNKYVQEDFTETNFPDRVKYGKTGDSSNVDRITKSEANKEPSTKAMPTKIKGADFITAEEQAKEKAKEQAKQ